MVQMAARFPLTCATKLTADARHRAGRAAARERQRHAPHDIDLLRSSTGLPRSRDDAIDQPAIQHQQALRTIQESPGDPLMKFLPNGENVSAVSSMARTRSAIPCCWIRCPCSTKDRGSPEPALRPRKRGQRFDRRHRTRQRTRAHHGLPGRRNRPRIPAAARCPAAGRAAPRHPLQRRGTAHPPVLVDQAIRDAIEEFTALQRAFRERVAASLTHDMRSPLSVVVSAPNCCWPPARTPQANQTRSSRKSSRTACASSR